MRKLQSFNAVVTGFAIAAALVFSGCSGAGGTSSGSISQASTASDVHVLGVATPIWQNVNGTPTGVPVCPTGVFLNSPVTFTFSGAVDPASLPPFGPAQGSINITTQATPGFSQPAIGGFTVSDDPTAFAGNNRRVTFTPTPPSGSGNACVSGFSASTTYTVFLPRANTAGSPTAVIVDGAGLTNTVSTCFTTCACSNPGPTPPNATCQAPFTDPVAGPPFVVSSVPAMANPATGPFTPTAIVGNTISLLISEALSPAGINLQNVRLINSATNAQVPGAVQFSQTGSSPSLVSNSRIDYIASSPLLCGVTYEITLAPAIVDFGGNSIQLAQGNPAARLLFTTVASTAIPQPQIVEDFTTTTNLGSATGALQWTGNGHVNTTFPTNLVGTGADGAFAPVANTTLDTNQLVGGVSRQGIFNYTTVNIPAGVTVRVIGPWPLHMRCQGAVTVNGTINASAGSSASVAIGNFDQGARNGQPQHGVPSNPAVVPGGVGNAGGGNGGNGSPNGLVRSMSGQTGFGASFNGLPNTAAGSSPHFGGGGAGASGWENGFGVVPAGNTTDIGGLGGSGGSAATQGEQGGPRAAGSSTACGLITVPATQAANHGVVQGVPPVFVQPVSIQTAGSGGGGAGDHLDNTAAIPTQDDQGGSGGGGGGGVRISCVGNYSQGGATPGSILANGGVAGLGATSIHGGNGGSGSGGEVWIQSFGTVTITAQSSIFATGGARPMTTGMLTTLCGNQAGAGGGQGLVQLEAGSGSPSTGFLHNPTVLATTPFPFSTTVTGSASSNFFDLAYGNPTLTGATASVSNAGGTGITFSVNFEGAFESVTSGGTPDLSTLRTTVDGTPTGVPITAATIGALTGYRFIRFRVAVTYPASLLGQVPAPPLPSLDGVTINFSAPPLGGC